MRLVWLLFHYGAVATCELILCYLRRQVLADQWAQTNSLTQRYPTTAKLTAQSSLITAAKLSLMYGDFFCKYVWVLKQQSARQTEHLFSYLSIHKKYIKRYCRYNSLFSLPDAFGARVPLSITEDWLWACLTSQWARPRTYSLLVALHPIFGWRLFESRKLHAPCS